MTPPHHASGDRFAPVTRNSDEGQDLKKEGHRAAGNAKPKAPVITTGENGPIFAVGENSGQINTGGTGNAQKSSGQINNGGNRKRSEQLRSDQQWRLRKRSKQFRPNQQWWLRPHQLNNGTIIYPSDKKVLSRRQIDATAFMLGYHAMLAFGNSKDKNLRVGMVQGYLNKLGIASAKPLDHYYRAPDLDNAMVVEFAQSTFGQIGMAQSPRAAEHFKHRPKPQLR